jgi:hypothetical protein
MQVVYGGRNGCFNTRGLILSPKNDRIDQSDRVVLAEQGHEAGDICSAVYRERDLDAPEFAEKTRMDMFLHDPIGTDKVGNEITLIDILGTEAEDVVDKVQLIIGIKRVYSVSNLWGI